MRSKLSMDRSTILSIKKWMFKYLRVKVRYSRSFRKMKWKQRKCLRKSLQRKNRRLKTNKRALVFLLKENWKMLWNLDNIWSLSRLSMNFRKSTKANQLSKSIWMSSSWHKSLNWISLKRLIRNQLAIRSLLLRRIGNLDVSSTTDSLNSREILLNKLREWLIYRSNRTNQQKRNNNCYSKSFNNNRTNRWKSRKSEGGLKEKWRRKSKKLGRRRPLKVLIQINLAAYCHLWPQWEAQDQT